MIDSGANISIAKRELAEKMGVMIRKVKEKIKIQAIWERGSEIRSDRICKFWRIDWGCSNSGGCQ